MSWVSIEKEYEATLSVTLVNIQDKITYTRNHPYITEHRVNVKIRNVQKDKKIPGNILQFSKAIVT